VTSAARRFPDVPGYAWAWLQRSRPVVHELAQRLTGGPPASDFLEQLRSRFDDDPFTSQVVADTVAEVAFGGRVPTARPAAASWDRGLSWWASALAGVPLRAYEAPAAQPAQRPLFDPGPADAGRGERRRSDRTRSPRQRERRALASALRQLLDASDGEQVPAAAVRQLLAQLEES
jgi:hypothetical protein